MTRRWWLRSSPDEPPRELPFDALRQLPPPYGPGPWVFGPPDAMQLQRPISMTVTPGN